MAIDINRLVVDRLLADKYGRWKEVFGSDQLLPIVERIHQEVAHFNPDDDDDDDGNAYIEDLEHTVKRVCEIVGVPHSEVFDDLGNGSMLDDAVGIIIERMEQWQKEFHNPSKLRP